MGTKAINFSREKKDTTNNSENNALEKKRKNTNPSQPQISDMQHNKANEMHTEVT